MVHLGFLGLFTLLQTNVVNFFYVLVCLLGFHTIMLAGWLIMTLINQGKQSSNWFASFVSPSYLIRGKDDVTLAAVNLYERQLQHSGMRWYLGRFSHQLWLATLTGMLLAIVFLLIVRQYSFSWESTLLADQTLIGLTNMLGWLPSMVGFSVPDSTAVIESRLAADAMSLSAARQWAGLLIGSLLMYGIVPRALAWAFCALMFRRQKMRLDINLPYYQKILSFWQRQVVDADDFKEEVVPVAPKADVSAGKKLVALLEYPSTQEKWWQLDDDTINNAMDNTTNNDVENFGIVDGREDMDRLTDYLNDNPKTMRYVIVLQPSYCCRSLGRHRLVVGGDLHGHLGLPLPALRVGIEHPDLPDTLARILSRCWGWTSPALFLSKSSAAMTSPIMYAPWGNTSSIWMGKRV